MHYLRSFPYLCLNILKDSSLNFCTISILNPYLLPCFDCQIHIALMITTKGLSVVCLLFLICKRHIAMVIYRFLHLFSVSVIVIYGFCINYAKMMRKMLQLLQCYRLYKSLIPINVFYLRYICSIIWEMNIFVFVSLQVKYDTYSISQ